MKSAVGVEVPEYNTEQPDLKPGLYLGLFHGRKPGEELDDWGSQGPVIGPLKFVHTTYGFHIKLEFEKLVGHHKYFPDTGSVWIDGRMQTWTCGPEAELFVIGVNAETDADQISDCVEYGGIYYGDWTVFVQK